MGSWGITERESDYGLDLLGTIVDTQLKQTGFITFNVADALDLVTADIMEEIRKANRGCSAEKLVFYFGISFPQEFTHGALLIAECLADYYCAGELIVTEYVGKNYDPVDHHIKEFVVTQADLKILLDELQSVQDPDHELYQAWFEDSDREKWLAHIQSIQQTLKNHVQEEGGSISAGTGAYVLAPPGPQSDRHSAGPHHQQYRYLCPLHHAGAFHAG